MKYGKALKFKSTAAALLLMLSLAGPASARTKTRKLQTAAGSQVVAHLPFTGLTSIDMALQDRAGDKRYLYVQHSQNDGVSVVDVSDPGKPKVLALVPWPDSHAANRLSVAGDFGFVSENQSTVAVRSDANRDDVVIWDLSNPASPRMVQKFDSVVRFLRDDKDFIYILNNDGLWVISAPKPAEPPFDPMANSLG